jgi:type IV pilus assembly protein PilW
MNARHSTPQSRQAGFSLVELMVGMTIGVIAGIIIIQVMSVFEAQRRTTTGSADAQTNGGIALYAIARELQMAGYPMMPHDNSPLECTAIAYGGTGITGIAPVEIADGTAGANPASDSITIRYGTTQSGGAPTTISALIGSAATVGSNLGCQVGDITLIVSGSSCFISRATALSAAGVTPITVTLEDATGAAAGANLACLGAWNEITYAVNPATRNLERTARVNGAAATTPNVVGIVNLQAQYGVSGAANSNQIASWVDASGGTWAAPVLANRNRIKAVRVAVIARNDKLEPAAVTAACTSTTSATPGGLCAWAGNATSPAPTVDLSPGNAAWDRFRYRVFETIIPLRNVIWSKDTL